MQFNIPVGVTSQLGGLGDHNELPSRARVRKQICCILEPSKNHRWISFSLSLTHTHIHKVLWPLSRLTWVSRWPPLSILLNLFRFNVSSRHWLLTSVREKGWQEQDFDGHNPPHAISVANQNEYHSLDLTRSYKPTWGSWGVSSTPIAMCATLCGLSIPT